MPSNDRRVLTIGQLIDEGQATLQTGPFGSQLHASEPVVLVLDGLDHELDHRVLDGLALLVDRAHDKVRVVITTLTATVARDDLLLSGGMEWRPG